MEMTTAARVVGGSDGFPGNTEESGYVSLSSNSIELEQTKQKRSSPCIRSGVLNKQQEGSGGFSIDDWRASKLTRTGCGFLNTSTATTATATATATATFLQNGSDSMKSGSATTTNLSAAYDAAVSSDPQLQQPQHQNMLCFSSGGSKSPEVTGGAGFAYYPPGVTVAAQPRNSGGGGGYHHQSAGITPLNTTAPSNNVYLLSGIRGPFTPSQWLELEQQALIYKYITSNEPIPRHLLIPIRIALEEAGMFAGLKPSLWGWGDMDPRYYSNRADPEPGRCRRTDGKKWRCSKDAMPDQKYCERHMNRGRHRSRKLVEAQANANNNNNHHSSSVLGVNKMDSPATTTMKLASSTSFGNGDSSYNSSYDFSKNFQPAASNPMVNRMMLGSSKLIQGMQQQDTTAQLTFLPPSINLNSSTNSPHNSFSISNATQFPYSESTPNLFGVPSTGSLIGTTTTPSENKTTAAAPFYTNYSTYDLNHRVTDPETHLHNSFVDEWPNAQPDNRASTTTSFLWPGLHSKHNTQLSMSIPMGPVDFMSSTSSPTHDKSAAAAVSPLSLSGELLDQTQVYLGVGLGSNYHTQSQGNTNTNIPVSWEVSMGGPLGEVLQSSGSSCYGNSYAGECGKKTSTSSSPLNLLPSSSPTGVLQKSALISLSNSSAGSSPRADNTKAIESGGCGGQSLQ